MEGWGRFTRERGRKMAHAWESLGFLGSVGAQRNLQSVQRVPVWPSEGQACKGVVMDLDFVYCGSYFLRFQVQSRCFSLNNDFLPRPHGLDQFLNTNVSRNNSIAVLRHLPCTQTKWVWPSWSPEPSQAWSLNTTGCDPKCKNNFNHEEYWTPSGMPQIQK